MAHYRYLIVGGGMTADAAVRGIRTIDPDGAIGLFSRETDPPYNKPPLSKGLWKGKAVEGILRRTERLGVDLNLNCPVSEINLHGKTVRVSGEEHSFEKLLLATGGIPRRLPFGGEDVIYFRSLTDYRRLRALSEQTDRIAVIGGGFIGSEIAAALAINGKKVSMLFMEGGIGARLFPANLASFVTEYYLDRGVEVFANDSIERLEKDDGEYRIRTQRGHDIRAGAVVAGLGIVPDTDLAKAAGLPVGDGILVDECLHAGHSDVFAAGDVASFYNSALKVRMRVEHEDNANTMGTFAGKNMALSVMGEREEEYTHLPYFYSDLFDLGYEAVGKLDPRLETVEDWQEPFRKGVVYYLEDGKVRGVLLWNVWKQVQAARELLSSEGRITAADLAGRIM